MMTRKMILLVLLTFSLTILHGQTISSPSRIVQTLDSIAKAKHITKAEANFKLISGTSDGTYSTDKSMSGVDVFRFEGPFIVIGTSYFNTEKLTSFFIFKDYFVLYFQVY